MDCQQSGRVAAPSGATTMPRFLFFRASQDYEAPLDCECEIVDLESLVVRVQEYFSFADRLVREARAEYLAKWEIRAVAGIYDPEEAEENKAHWLAHYDERSRYLAEWMARILGEIHSAQVGDRIYGPVDHSEAQAYVAIPYDWPAYPAEKEG
jgi:hypothetical protein